MCSRYDRLMPSIADAIGNTPLVDLKRFVKNSKNLPVGSRILAKCENMNPGMSKKDRIALQMIEEAEKNGNLLPGQTVIELTSGNTGTGLAIVCAVTGHPCLLVMSEGNSKERARMMQALGAEVILVPQAEGNKPGQVTGEDYKRALTITKELAKERGAFRANQFKLSGNINAHYYHTGPEIWK